MTRGNGGAGGAAAHWTEDKWMKLLCCIALDLIGFFSFLVPGLGEGSDLAWGPISAYCLYRLFPNQPMMAVVNFAEETLPFLDFLPTACIAWYIQHGRDAPQQQQQQQQVRSAKQQ